MGLYKSDRFQNEYKDFSKRISSITNEKIKQELSELLTKLVRVVKDLDNQHERLMTAKQLPMGIEDARNDISEIRKKIVRKLRDWDAISQSS